MVRDGQQTRSVGAGRRAAGIVLPILGLLVAAAVLGGSYYLARPGAIHYPPAPTLTPGPVLSASTPVALAPVQFPRPPDKQGAGKYVSTDVPQRIPDNSRK